MITSPRYGLNVHGLLTPIEDETTFDNLIATHLTRLRETAPDFVSWWQTYDLSDLLERAFDATLRGLRIDPSKARVTEQRLQLASDLGADARAHFWQRWTFELLRLTASLMEYTRKEESWNRHAYLVHAERVTPRETHELKIVHALSLRLELSGFATRTEVEREYDLILAYLIRFGVQITVQERAEGTDWLGAQALTPTVFFFPSPSGKA